ALTLRFDRFRALRRETVEAAVSGTLTARGALTAPEVNGTLDVEHAVLRPAGLPSTRQPLQPNPTITVVGLEEPPAPVAAEPTPGLPAPLALAVTIRIAHDASVRRSDANIALGRGQSVALQQQALQIATGYVVPELRNSVMNVLGLDTLEVAFPDRTEAPGQVRVGRYVGQDVLISLGQEFGTRVAQVAGVEYAVGANVSVRASTSTRGASAVDLIWQRRY